MRAQLLANSVIAGHIGDSSRTPDRHAGNACELAGLSWPIAKSIRSRREKSLDAVPPNA